jgi:hypothetical protein
VAGLSGQCEFLKERYNLVATVTQSSAPDRLAVGFDSLEAEVVAGRLQRELLSRTNKTNGPAADCMDPQQELRTHRLQYDREGNTSSENSPELLLPSE